MPDKSAQPKTLLDADRLAAAVTELLALAVELELIRDTSTEREDANVYKKLFALEGTHHRLEEIVDLLLAQKARRLATVNLLRVARFSQHVTGSLRAQARLPDGAREVVQREALLCGLDLNESAIDAVLQALSRHGRGSGEGRAKRVTQLLLGKESPSESTVRGIVKLTKQAEGRTPKATLKRRTGGKVQRSKVRDQDQLKAGFYETEGASAYAAYALGVLGKSSETCERAAGEALAAWNDVYARESEEQFERLRERGNRQQKTQTLAGSGATDGLNPSHSDEEQVTKNSPRATHDRGKKAATLSDLPARRRKRS